MGARGPVPKRSSERVRRNKDSVKTTKAPGAQKVRVPRADPSWHPLAKSWYNSLKKSGQSQFFEPSDWAYAKFVAYQMTLLCQEKRVRAASLQTIMAGMNDLLTTEGARRRVRIELERETPDDDLMNVANINDYRSLYQ